MSGVIPPAEWQGKLVPALDVLLFMRDKIREGFTPEIFFGRIDVWALGNFVDGIGFYMECCGVADDEVGAFWKWLRDKGEYVDPGSWQGKYLSDCHGDHRAAILMFLDRCAEFAALYRSSNGEGA